MTNQARSDIVERLRGTADSAEEAGFTHAAEIAREAADEIERLEAENEQLRIALMDRSRDDGTAIAAGGEPGASASKSE